MGSISYLFGAHKSGAHPTDRYQINISSKWKNYIS
jgi:hypothetical protein